MKASNAFFLLETANSLFFFGAAGLAVLGEYMNAKIGVSTSIYPVLWVAGSLYVYNLDRLLPDAADPINLPERVLFGRFRKILIGLSLIALIFTPIWLKQWLVLLLLLPALVFSSLYSLRPPGFSSRIKDILLLKWLAPPLVILATLTIPIWIDPSNWRLIPLHWALFGGVFIALLTNILLFDQRDQLGDLSVGLHTISNKLPPQRFFLVLFALFAVQILFLAFDPQPEMILFAFYMAVLIGFARRKRSAGFYHWAVDGMLFIPAIGQWLVRLQR